MPRSIPYLAMVVLVVLWWGLALLLARRAHAVPRTVGGQLFKVGVLFAAFCSGLAVLALLVLLAIPIGAFIGTFCHE
jgi:hypothetical protein